MKVREERKRKRGENSRVRVSSCLQAVCGVEVEVIEESE